MTRINYTTSLSLPKSITISDANVTLDHMDAGYDTGTLCTDVNNGDLVYSVPRYPESKPDITAYNIVITIDDTFYSNQPIRVYVNNEFALLAKISNVYYWDEAPNSRGVGNCQHFRSPIPSDNRGKRIPSMDKVI